MRIALFFSLFIFSSYLLLSQPDQIINNSNDTHLFPVQHKFNHIVLNKDVRTEPAKKPIDFSEYCDCDRGLSTLANVAENGCELSFLCKNREKFSNKRCDRYNLVSIISVDSVVSTEIEDSLFYAYLSVIIQEQYYSPYKASIYIFPNQTEILSDFFDSMKYYNNLIDNVENIFATTSVVVTESEYNRLVNNIKDINSNLLLLRYEDDFTNIALQFYLQGEYRLNELFTLEQINMMRQYRYKIICLSFLYQELGNVCLGFRKKTYRNLTENVNKYFLFNR